jgi:hypothetical protein
MRKLNISKLARDCIDRLEESAPCFTKADVVELLAEPAGLTADSLTLNAAVHNALREQCVCVWMDGSAMWFPKNNLVPAQIIEAAKQHREWSGVISGGIAQRCDDMASIAVKVAEGMTYKAAEQLVQSER